MEPELATPSDLWKSAVDESAVATLEGIAGIVRSMPGDDSVATRQTLLDLVARIGHSDNVRRLVDAIDRDAKRLVEIANRSFRHTNYFDKIVLLDDEIESTYRLTLHLWRPPFTQEEVDDDHIHDHRCDFWSTVLFGVLQSEEFVRSDNGPKFQELTYRPARTDRGVKVNEYVPAGAVGLRRTRVVRHATGATYFLPRERIHRIAISQREPTATLLLRGPHRTASTSLFSNTRCYSNIALAPFEVPVLRDRLDFVRNHLP